MLFNVRRLSLALTLFFALSKLFLWAQVKEGIRGPAGPFPIVAEIKTVSSNEKATLQVYPDYAEVYSAKNTLIFRAGVLPDKGNFRVFTVLNTETPKLIAYTEGNILFDAEGNFIGSFYATPVYTYTYSKSGKRLGSAKCIAFSTVCSTAASVYLILLS